MPKWNSDWNRMFFQRKGATINAETRRTQRDLISLRSLRLCASAFLPLLPKLNFEAKAQENEKRSGQRGPKKKLGETGTPTMEENSQRAGLASGALEPLRCTPQL